MPSVADRGTNVVDMSGYEPVDNAKATPTGSSPSPDLEPGYNIYIRCPLPPIWSTTPDTLRQFYQNHVVPQTRLFNPPSNNGGNTGGTTINNVSSGSSSSSSTVSSIAVSQTSFTTPSITSGNRFTGTINLGRAFQLLTVSANAPCRIQLYGTSLAQLGDAYRGLDVPPPAGSTQNIICDVVLDTSPFQWSFQDRVGANGDNPVSPTAYITVTNIDVTTDVFTLSFEYVPIVS